MKKLYRTMFFALAGALTLASCSSDQLETEPTDSMSGSTFMSNASSALVPLNGIYRSMYSAGWSTTGNTHQCFGISAYNLMAEVMGDDMIMAAQGSGWFWFDAAYNVKSRYASSNWRSYDLWKAYYTWIANANYIIAAEETMSGSSTDVNYVIGQAYAIRAYSYFMAAQIFARTYAGHQSEPGLPIYNEPTYTSTTGQPRSTVEETYAQIKSDIDKACSLLQGTTQQHCSHMGYAVAQGIRSRVALVMEDWSTALDAAQKAISASGCSILPVASFIGVNDADADNVMWGAEIVSDQAGMYASFFAHMSKDVAYGLRAHKQIPISLYNKMKTTDTRRAWWDPTDEASDGGYIQVKFDFSNLATWEGDYVWMRVEEMYLNAAEAACRLGQEDVAKQYLLTLMAQRDPNYTCTKTGTTLGTLTNDVTGSLLEEIITQRRIELWGEDGRIYTIRRLRQGFVRSTDDGWPSALAGCNTSLNDPESYAWVLTIPQAEFDGNENMDATKDQNPTGNTK